MEKGGSRAALFVSGELQDRLGSDLGRRAACSSHDAQGLPLAILLAFEHTRISETILNRLLDVSRVETRLEEFRDHFAIGGNIHKGGEAGLEEEKAQQRSCDPAKLVACNHGGALRGQLCRHGS